MKMKNSLGDDTVAKIKKWKWKQLDGPIWIIESDREKGQITVYDEKTKMELVKRTGLGDKAMELIEKCFLDAVGEKIEIKKTKKEIDTDMMYR